MKDAGDKITPIEPSRKLSDAIREVKNAFADRDDVVVEQLAEVLGLPPGDVLPGYEED